MRGLPDQPHFEGVLDLATLIGGWLRLWLVSARAVLLCLRCKHVSNPFHAKVRDAVLARG